MDLDVNGATVANPTADDIAHALDATSYAVGWYITLMTKSGAMLDAVEGRVQPRCSGGLKPRLARGDT